MTMADAAASRLAPRPLIFLWENFGPMHADRCDAVARLYGIEARVVGLELLSRSEVYEWASETRTSFDKTTLFPQARQRPGIWRHLREIARFRARHAQSTWFMCHYERPEILLAAWYLRLRGHRVFTMGCSKFDDLPRKAWREWLKSFYLRPYHGAIGSGIRSIDYFRFLGFGRRPVVGEYNTVSLSRIRALSETVPAPGGTRFSHRHFTIVARLVPKKNLQVALRAYALYRTMAASPRPLHLCGSGPLEVDLIALAQELGIREHVTFHGFVQSAEVARILGSTLALLLPSIEEQFGNVVIEAQAMGLPVILSDNCGARDLLVRVGVNGFVIEPDNPGGLAWCMCRLSDDEQTWATMADAATRSAEGGDVARFAEAVKGLAA